MSAILQSDAGFANWSVVPMAEADVAEVERVERAVYPFPWTVGNFADSLKSEYQCVTSRVQGGLAGYAVQMYVIDEAHLLNITIVPALQRAGHGTRLLQWLMEEARARRMASLFLEVRPSNGGAKSLYDRFGFTQVGVRRDYYPAHGGREDALVLKAPL